MRTALFSLLFALNAMPLEPIPDKTVVLTFDDSPKSHRAFVAPLLKELGFGATFFISARWMEDTANFMTWAEIAEIHAMGFEIGNHSWSHLDFGAPVHAARLAGQLALVENELERAGVPRPISFAWCGNSFGPEGRAVLAERGYVLARRGMQPEVPYGQAKPGPLYDPAAHDPLLLPSAGDAYPNWTLDNFRRVVDRACDGKIAIVQFHGVPDVAHPWVNTPPERFREYMDYLKANNFHVIALRDLLKHVDPAVEVADAMKNVHYGPKEMELPAEVQASRVNTDEWLQNMLFAHRFTHEEAAGVLRWPVARVQAWEKDFSVEKTPELPLLPYPGGRHPRIGFLDGAIDPLRGTKLSVFAPWKDGGYALVDLPEAVFSNRGLHFLAHTHVPTIWDKQHIQMENSDWEETRDGAMENLWHLPDGVTIRAQAEPTDSGASFKLTLHNGTPELLTGLRTQVCVMLKGLTGFDAQSNANKEFATSSATAFTEDGKRRVTITFSHCGRTWGNEKCPCIHADPIFPDCPPGEHVQVTGGLHFAEK